MVKDETRIDNKEYIKFYLKRYTSIINFLIFQMRGDYLFWCIVKYGLYANREGKLR